MSQLLVSLAWCWAQAMVVATVAIVLSALAMRRSPAASAAIAWAGVLAAFAVVLLAAAPLPQWTRRLPLGRLPLVAAHTEGQAAEPVATTPSTEYTPAASMAGLLRDFVAAARNSQAKAASHRGAGRLALAASLIAMSFGLVRIAYGIWAIAKLRRQSRAVADPRLTAVVSELASSVGLRSLPEVRESSDLASAAVVGWWRAAVLLPAEWSEWSATELRAVIAHELAHMARCDLHSRHVAALAVAIHFAQPLVYWLRRQLILAQEMAADELAASAVGSRAEYVRSLSRMALRQDARAADVHVAMLLPVFSGFLLRRIEMLRAKDGSAGRGLRLTLQWSAIAVLLAASASTTALRGLAEPPDAKEDQPDRVARASDPTLKPQAAANLFRRAAFDPKTVAMGETTDQRGGGGLVIRLGEILRQPEFAEAARSLDEGFNAAWKEAFPALEPPAWSFGDVDFIAGAPRLTFGRRLEQPRKDDEKQTFMIGADWVVIRWQKPLTDQYEAFASAPGTVKKSHQGKEYLELPVIPAYGPVKTYLCRLDDHTLLTGDEAGLRRRLDKLAAEASPPSWNAAWQQIDGGLITLVTTFLQVNRPFQDDVEAEKGLTNLFSRQLAVGVDWPPAAGGPPIVKVRIRCESADDADQLRTELHQLRGLLERLVEQQLPDHKFDEAETQIARSLLDSLRQTRAETQHTDAGWQLAAEFACPWEYFAKF